MRYRYSAASILGELANGVIHEALRMTAGRRRQPPCGTVVGVIGLRQATPLPEAVTGRRITPRLWFPRPTRGRQAIQCVISKCLLRLRGASDSEDVPEFVVGICQVQQPAGGHLHRTTDRVVGDRVRHGTGTVRGETARVIVGERIGEHNDGPARRLCFTVVSRPWVSYS